jgi:hypothetical protein
MPYIKRTERLKFEGTIKDAITQLLQNKPDVIPGELNYVLSSIIWRLWDKKPSYSRGSMLIGILDDVKEEFRRRKINIYEDQKIKENGDL